MRRERQANGESGSFSMTAALGGYCAAVPFDRRLGDGKAKTQPPELLRNAGILPKRFEQIDRFFWIKAPAIVRHLEDNPLGAFISRSDFDLTAFRRELGGILQKIPKNLLQAICVAAHSRMCGRQVYGESMFLCV